MKTEQGKVKINDEAFKGEVPYTRTIVESLTDAETWSLTFYDDVKNGKRTATDAAIDLLNYAIDLKIRSQVRQEQLAKVAGPDKALARSEKGLVDAFMASGMSEADAKALAATQMASVRALIK